MEKIAFHGVPRSGTTWVGSIFDSSENVAYLHQPLFSFEFKSYLNESSNKQKIDNFFTHIKNTKDDFVLQKEGKEKGIIPSFKKNEITHVVYKEARYHHILNNLLEQHEDLKVVGIIRNPKSIISSWYNAPKEFNKKEWNLITEWRDAPLKNLNKIEEFYGFTKWKEVSNLFLYLKEKFPERFYLLEYTKLLQNTKETVKELFEFCNINFGIQTNNFINKSKSIDLSSNSYSVFRINQSDEKWKNDLPLEIIKSIDLELKGTRLEKFLYE